MKSEALRGQCTIDAVIELEGYDEILEDDQAEDDWGDSDSNTTDITLDDAEPDSEKV